MSKANELREYDAEELTTRLNDAREELMNLRFQQASGELTDHNRMNITRREIARLLTVLNEQPETANVEEEK
jgi:large subunit ribosomal protein L29